MTFNIILRNVKVRKLNIVFADRNLFALTSSYIVSRYRSNTMFNLIVSMLFEKLNMFSTFFVFKSADFTQIRVIAVDEFDQQAVQIIMQNFQRQLLKHISLVVRIFSSLSIFDRHNILDFNILQYITQWHSFWTFFLRTSLFNQQLNRIKTFNRNRQTSNSSQLCINIVFFIFLMMTFKVANANCAMNANIEYKYWQWLTSQWHDNMQFDIIIHVKNVDHYINERNVLRIWDICMKTFVITELFSIKNNIALTSKQLRKIIFEIEKWLRNENT